MHTVFALLCFVVVIHWLIFPYPSGLLHWHCGNLTIAPVPAKQPWWIWINTSCEFIMNDCITTTKQSTTEPCAYFLGYTVISVSNPCALIAKSHTSIWYPLILALCAQVLGWALKAHLIVQGSWYQSNICCTVFIDQFDSQDLIKVIHYNAKEIPTCSSKGLKHWDIMCMFWNTHFITSNITDMISKWAKWITCYLWFG